MFGDSVFRALGVKFLATNLPAREIHVQPGHFSRDGERPLLGSGRDDLLQLLHVWQLRDPRAARGHRQGRTAGHAGVEPVGVHLLLLSILRNAQVPQFTQMLLQYLN